MLNSIGWVGCTAFTAKIASLTTVALTADDQRFGLETPVDVPK